MITAVLRRRVVTIVGEEGIGKTAVAAAASHYISERRMLPDGVVYVKLQPITNHTSFLSALQQAIAAGPTVVHSYFYRHGQSKLLYHFIGPKGLSQKLRALQQRDGSLTTSTASLDSSAPLHSFHPILDQKSVSLSSYTSSGDVICYVLYYVSAKL